MQQRHGEFVPDPEFAMPRRLQSASAFPLTALFLVTALFLGIGLTLSCSSDGIPGVPANRGPTAKITLPSGPLLEGANLTFDARNSSDPDGALLTYRWNLGDGITRTDSIISRVYLDEGSYDVSLIVSDPQGAEDTATARVVVENAAPVVVEIVGPAGSIGVGNPTAIHVRASDPGAADSLTMRIDWQDGTTSTLGYRQDQPEAVATHTYSAVGTYAVELTIQDTDGGNTKRAIANPIVVVPRNDPGGNRAPTAKIDQISPGPIVEGSVVTFDGASSSDPDGDPLMYRWNTGYQLSYQPSRDLVSYPTEGSFAITLIVTDSQGASDTATMEIRVENAPPTVDNVVTPAGAVLAGTSSTIRFQVGDPGVNDTVAAVQVDWKDGSTSTPTLTRHSYDARFNATAAHTYSTTGTYPVEITARDNDSGVTKLVVDHPITVVGPHANHPPVARITGPTSGSEGAWIVFSGASSADPDGDSLKVRCHARDGRHPPQYPGYPEQSCTIAFPDNGTYVVSAIAADDSGAVDTASMSVTITNVPPKLEWLFAPAHEALGVPGSIQVLVNDPGSADRDTIVVNWGDGTSQTFGEADSSLWVPYDGAHELGATLFHTYQSTGSYTITVTARDDDGGMSNTIASSSPVIVFNASRRQTVAGYEATDLGTLGGNWARPADLNDRGQIVGTSMTDHWALHAFLWDESGMHDLGTMGHHASEAVRINEGGLIAGTVWERGTGTLDDNCISSAVGTTWQNGVATSLAGQGFCHNTYDPYYWFSGQLQPRLVRAMNNAGDIALIGYGKFDISSRLWRNGWQQMPLPSPWYPFYPTAMNDRGQAVGTAHQGEGSPLFRAFLWEDGAGRDLGILAPTTCQSGVDCDDAAAQDINESGQIVGISTGAGHYHFVLWQDDKIEDLGLADWTVGEPRPRIVINNHGDIAASVGGRAYFWSGGVKTQLPSAGGALDVVQLNENGDVVGNILMGGRQHVFVWSKSRGLIDLGTGPDGFDAAWVVDVNARGDILGYTAPCKVTYSSPTHCTDRAVDYWATQVRPILWRKQ